MMGGQMQLAEPLVRCLTQAMADLAGPSDITAQDLARAIEAGEPIQVVDIRAPNRLAAGRIDTVPPDRFHNIVGSRLREHACLDTTGLDPAIPMAVVCGHGNDSRVLAQHLNGLGARARSLKGGMAAWMLVAVPRVLSPPPSLDRLIQLDRIGKGALGYVLVSDGEALIIDPPRDASAYLQAADDGDARVVGVADTHVHADYISGGPALARTLGVPYYLHAADAVYPYDGTPGTIAFHGVSNGDTITVGRSHVRVRHTPGHTDGSVTYLVDGAAFTGDFLFVNSIGRPDLAGKTAEWTDKLWASVEAARREWPPDTVVYPAHYASDAERRTDRAVAGTFGDMVRDNVALRITGWEEFAAWVRRQAGSFPEAYKTIKAVNVGLLTVDDRQAEELEVGRNECALGGN
jgi:glyoxylase-like metal-dependent hydrolase (beta-lactamase superfamily II)